MQRWYNETHPLQMSAEGAFIHFREAPSVSLRSTGDDSVKGVRPVHMVRTVHLFFTPYVFSLWLLLEEKLSPQVTDEV